MDLIKIQQQIKKTRYTLVSDMTRLLEEHGWSVINNRYYLSDQSDVLSEIDIVASKTKSVGWCEYETDVNTVLLITLKKSDDYAWGLLTRETKTNGVDHDWVGNSFWTNTSYFRYLMDTGAVNQDYVDALARAKLQLTMNLSGKHIFALQEIDEQSGTHSDERRIAESIHELVRARRYESNVLAETATKDSVYHYHLISVVDSKLLEINLQNKALDIRELKEVGYIGKFVVDTGETAAGITFLEAKHFPHALERYEKIHLVNCDYVKRKDMEFYKDIVRDPRRLRYLQRVLAKRIRERLHRHGYLPTAAENKDMRIWGVRWDSRYDGLVVDIETTDVRPEVLNEDSELHKSLAGMFYEVLRYKGWFRFDLYIPF